MFQPFNVNALLIVISSASLFRYPTVGGGCGGNEKALFRCLEAAASVFFMNILLLLQAVVPILPKGYWGQAPIHRHTLRIGLKPAPMLEKRCDDRCDAADSTVTPIGTAADPRPSLNARSKEIRVIHQREGVHSFLSLYGQSQLL